MGKKEEKTERPSRPRLCIVVPCYNEEEALPGTDAALSLALAGMAESGRISPDSFICYVNDGSSDATWQVIERLAAERPGEVRGLSLSRNRGHQNALLCGLTEVIGHADITISIDADLQDDVGAMPEMVDRYMEGCDVVYGVRRERPDDTFFKRATALAFYRVMRALDRETVFNHADYRLLSDRALRALAEFREVSVYIRGVIPKLGFRSASVMYDRKPREAGETKYTLAKMLALAAEGIFSASAAPIRAITAMGGACVAFGVICLIYSLVMWARGATVAGWASIIVSLWLVGGMVLISLGVIGEYVGRIYIEVKHRPRYIVERRLNFGRPRAS